MDSRGDVCRYVWKGQSAIDGCWGVFAEVKVYMTKEKSLSKMVGLIVSQFFYWRETLQVSFCYHRPRAFYLKSVSAKQGRAKQVDEGLVNVKISIEYASNLTDLQILLE